jgi:hypothetical protein
LNFEKGLLSVVDKNGEIGFFSRCMMGENGGWIEENIEPLIRSDGRFDLSSGNGWPGVMW